MPPSWPVPLIAGSSAGTCSRSSRRPVIVYATSVVAVNVLTEAGLSSLAWVSHPGTELGPDAERWRHDRPVSDPAVGRHRAWARPRGNDPDAERPG